MPRIGLIPIALLVLAGCHAPGFNPLGLNTQTRVPPPPTGAIGNHYGGYGNDYYEPVPRPNLGQGAANWPASEFVPATSLATNHHDNFSQHTPPATSIPSQADSRPTLQRSDNLSWVDPFDRQSGTRAPGLLPPTGQTQPLVSAPRVRGFHNTGSPRDLYVPQQLADFRGNSLPRSGGLPSGVRQASVSSNWQRRYDDVRR